jgi:hypothetical protein
MRRFRRLILGFYAKRSGAAELVGLGLVAAGLHQFSEPAALVFAGASLIFIAQGMERRE